MSSLKVCILLQAFLLAFVQSDLKERVNYALLRKATQSSTDGEYEASWAVDLFVSQSWTEDTEDPWWSVDLGTPHLIQEIRFLAYATGPDRRIDVLLSKEVLGNITEANDNYVLCGSMEPKDKEAVVKCSSKDVHNCVSIRASGAGELSISYVFVYGSHFRYNHAFSKSTSSSGQESRLAVDGRLETCSSTQEIKNAWWSVDLGAPYLIDEVVVYRSWVPVTDRVLMVYMSEEKPDGSSNKKLVECGNSTVGVVKCSSKEKHQHVLVKATNKGDVELCEVQVYGKGILINHAWYKDTTQSSTAGDHESNLAIDADETSCSQTEETVDPWWSMDLGATYLMEKVEVKGELTGETNEPISAEMILSQESSSILGEHFNRWKIMGSFHEIIQNPGNEPYRYFKLKVEGKAGLKVCDVLVLEGLSWTVKTTKTSAANKTTPIELNNSQPTTETSEANETIPIKQDSFNHLTWVLPLFGVVFCLGVLGFMALRLSKNKAKGETVTNGSNR